MRMKDGRALHSYGINEGNMIELIEKLKVGCFPGGTSITLTSGKKKRISDISKDDVILAYD